MVSIGKLNWLSLGASKVGQTQPSNAHFAGVKLPQGGNTLQDRLAAIDRGDFLSLTGSSRISSNSGTNRSQSNSLLSRLDAIGTGELSPQYGNNEKKFDWIM